VDEPQPKELTMTEIVLKRPVEHEGKTYTTVTIDEPTVAAMIAAEKARTAGGSELEAIAAMVATDNGWPMAAAVKLRMGDVAAISEALVPLLEAPAAGAAGEP
jgi:hypothetical protein